MARSPGIQHQITLGALVFSLYGPIDVGARGMLLKGCGVALASDTLVVPDLVFVSEDRRGIIGERYIEGAPDLLTEVISPGSEKIDWVYKRDLYAKHGVRYYWLAHPREQWVLAYELQPDGQYERSAQGYGDTEFSAPPFSDLPIQLADLWEE